MSDEGSHDAIWHAWREGQCDTGREKNAHLWISSAHRRKHDAFRLVGQRDNARLTTGARARIARHLPITGAMTTGIAMAGMAGMAGPTGAATAREMASAMGAAPGVATADVDS